MWPHTRAQDGQALIAQIAGYVRQHRPVLLLCVISMIVQWSFWRAAEPKLFPDSDSYQQLVSQIVQGKTSGFHFRTPGYPAFLALVQSLAGTRNYNAVIAAQFALGASIPVLLYGLYRKVVSHRLIAVASALIFFADWPSVAIQATILTEPLAQFLLVANVTAAVYLSRQKHWWGAGALAGLQFCLLILRPSFQFLPWVFAALGILAEFAARTEMGRWRRTALWWLGSALAAQALIFAWSIQVHRHTGHRTLSLLGGMALMNHVGPIAEVAEGNNLSPLRASYLEAVEKRGGNHINATYDLIADQVQHAGRKEWDVAADIQSLALSLIWSHPTEYLQSVLQKFPQVWTDYPTYLFEPSRLKTYTRTHPIWKHVYGTADRLLWSHPGRLLMIPILFLSGAAVYAIWHRRDPQRLRLSVFTAGAVFYNACFHAAANATELGRYRLVAQPLYFSFLVFLALAACAETTRRFSRRHPALNSVVEHPVADARGPSR